MRTRLAASMATLGCWLSNNVIRPANTLAPLENTMLPRRNTCSRWSGFAPVGNTAFATNTDFLPEDSSPNGERLPVWEGCCRTVAFAARWVVNLKDTPSMYNYLQPMSGALWPLSLLPLGLEARNTGDLAPISGPLRSTSVACADESNRTKSETELGEENIRRRDR